MGPSGDGGGWLIAQPFPSIPMVLSGPTCTSSQFPVPLSESQKWGDWSWFCASRNFVKYFYQILVWTWTWTSWTQFVRFWVWVHQHPGLNLKVQVWVQPKVPEPKLNWTMASLIIDVWSQLPIDAMRPDWDWEMLVLGAVVLGAAAAECLDSGCSDSGTQILKKTVDSKALFATSSGGNLTESCSCWLVCKEGMMIATQKQNWI